MTDGFDAAAYADFMSGVMGIEVLPEWKPGVVAYLGTASRMAGLVLAHPLDDHVEPAYVFEA